MSRPLPAARAAGPNAANTPAPIIDPSPMTTASPVPSRRASPPVMTLIPSNEFDVSSGYGVAGSSPAVRPHGRQPGAVEPAHGAGRQRPPRPRAHRAGGAAAEPGLLP